MGCAKRQWMLRCYKNSGSSNTRWSWCHRCVSISSSANFYKTDSNCSHFVDSQNGRQRHQSSFWILSCPRCSEQRKWNLTRSCKPGNYVSKIKQTERWGTYFLIVCRSPGPRCVSWLFKLPYLASINLKAGVWPTSITNAPSSQACQSDLMSK